MEINGKTNKNLKAIFRAQVAGGQQASRNVYLAYAFVRGVPYKVLERVINEDKECFSSGRNGYLKWRAYCVSVEICKNCFDKLKEEEINNLVDMTREERDEYNNTVKSVSESVCQWIMKKYEDSAEVAA